MQFLANPRKFVSSKFFCSSICENKSTRKFLHGFSFKKNAMNICYLEYMLPQAFSLVLSALSLNVLINSFGISNPSISNFHYVELFSRSFQRILGLLSICCLKSLHFAHSNVERIDSKTLIECLSFLT